MIDFFSRKQKKWKNTLFDFSFSLSEYKQANNNNCLLKIYIVLLFSIHSLLFVCGVRRTYFHIENA